jgi:hypothetical protein
MMAEQQAQLPVVKRRGTKQYVVLALVAVGILAVAAAVSFYSDEIHLYLSVGGWNGGTATRIAQQFIHHLQAGQQQKAIALLDPESFQTYQQDGKVVGLEHKDVSGRGRYRILFSEFIPRGPAEVRPAQLTGADQGGFVVPVRFADHTEGWFVVGRVPGGYRIINLPMVPGRFHY